MSVLATSPSKKKFLSRTPNSAARCRICDSSRPLPTMAKMGRLLSGSPSCRAEAAATSTSHPAPFTSPIVPG